MALLKLRSRSDVEAIDEWRSLEPGNPSRSEAIRCLMGMGLSAADAERKQLQGWMETLRQA
jgi:hypothetical protein